MSDQNCMIVVNKPMPAPQHVPPEVLPFISENQKLSGFSSHISEKTASFVPDMAQISNSAKRFKAQVPTLQRFRGSK